MEKCEIDNFYEKLKFGDDNFYDLMKCRVSEILLISTFYDAYTFEQDFKLSQKIVGQYHQLNLTTIPRISSVPTADSAIEKLKEKKFDMVIATMRIGKLSPFEFAKIIKKEHPDLPVILLLTVKTDIAIVNNNIEKMKFIDEVFLWNGDSKLFLAMIKQTEDKKNIEYDTENGMVRVILLVEDSINFYSIYMPLLYTEIMKQTQRLILEELNDMQKYYRMRQRPKVVLVKNFEDAIKVIDRYKDYLLCVISDVSYPKDGIIDRKAGIKLITKLKEEGIDVPYLLQSSELIHKPDADKLGVHFIHKHSPILLNELSSFILSDLGFGDFVFRNEEGEILARAKSMKNFEELLKTIPVDSFLYHCTRNHFSAWLIAHGEIQVARRIRPVRNSDFPDTETHRRFLVNIFKEVRRQRHKGEIVDFNQDINDDIENLVVRLQEGSLGGKGRGIAFLNTLLCMMKFENKYDDATVRIPFTAFIGTNEFDDFIANNNLGDIIGCHNDADISQRFLNGNITKQLEDTLREFLKHTDKPIAVRSSGLLEDSQSQPFAGIYNTYMMPNNNPDFEIRYQQLSNAIKLVFASVYLENTKSYIESMSFRVEDEKMAVVIQEIVGNMYDGYYYPHFSGVAQSYNYYPVSYMTHEDGVATIAVGLGQSVVEGEKTFRFCPKYPDLQYLSVEDTIKFSQTHFYAIDMNLERIDFSKGDHATLKKLEIRDCENHKNLYHLASTWDIENNRIEDGISCYGPRIINFSNILKYKYFPLSEILSDILEVSEKAFGVPVEIEFAVDLTSNKRLGIKPSFYLLQVRPLTVNEDEISINPEEIEKNDLILYTEDGMGNGIISDIKDIIFINPEKFDKTMTEKMALEVEEFNRELKNEDIKYILIGPGRWGTRDRFLGVPVQWKQISNARVIVECGMKDFDVEPSQGTHFFHNLIAMNVGYFNIKNKHKKSFVNWETLLNSENIVKKGEYFIHIRRDKPFITKMDGKNGLALISNI